MIFSYTHPSPQQRESIEAVFEALGRTGMEVPNCTYALTVRGSSTGNYNSLIHQGITVDDGLIALRPDGDDVDGGFGKFFYSFKIAPGSRGAFCDLLSTADIFLPPLSFLI